MKVEVYILIHYDNEKYFYISDQNDQEYPNLINHILLVHLKGTPENRSKSLLIGLDESFKLTRTIWFSEKTPGTLHQNVPEDKKIHILIHKSYIGIEIIVNFENLQMHKYIPEREISVFLNTLRIFPFHFSVYQMMIHSAIWKERDLCFLFINILISKKKKH
ncbi:hypothetical protein ACJX0J_001756 [Zea mays]